MADAPRPLAVVTGASSGIGRALAHCCADHGYDLVIAADESAIDLAAAELRPKGCRVDAVQADLATAAGVDSLCAAIAGRPVAALLANAGTGVGGAFLDLSFDQVRHIVDTNVTGTVDLVHRVGNGMRVAGSGRILITGSIAGFVPGPFNSIYNSTKAFIDSFAAALRNELQGSGITVTCLMPGATDTDFYARAGMLDTLLHAQPMDDPADVARIGFDAMLDGAADVISGWRNKALAAAAHVTPASVLAAAHRKLAEPGSATPPG